MSKSHSATYPPINTLKPVADDVFIVDGPTIEFGPAFLHMPFSTRMTILRLNGGELFVHSPTPLTDELREAIAAIGQPRWIIGPNRIHYWWIPEWRAAFPEAAVHLAPRVKEQARGRIDFDALSLTAAGGYPWDAAIATLPIVGGYMTEVEFFHKPSRTLILTDLIENFETHRIPSLWKRWIIRLAGVADPHGGMPPDMRMTFWRQRSELKAAIRTMAAWEPERVILAHGRWFETDGSAELRRALPWAFK